MNDDRDDRLRADLCGCRKPSNCYGSRGWHFRVSRVHADYVAQDVAYEKCREVHEALQLRLRAKQELEKSSRGPDADDPMGWGMNEALEAARHGSRIYRESMEVLERNRVTNRDSQEDAA